MDEATPMKTALSRSPMRIELQYQLIREMNKNDKDLQKHHPQVINALRRHRSVADAKHVT
jgi:hypothetical protein